MPQDMLDAVLSQSSAGQNPSQPTNQPEANDGLEKILAAAGSLSKEAMSDPAYASAMLHAKALENEGQTIDDTRKQAMVNAYKSIYGQRAMEQQGGNADLQQALQQRASSNSALGNFARAGANAFAQTGANLVGIVAPDYANKIGAQATQEYNPDVQSGAGKAGELAGNIVSTLPAVLAPGAAPLAFGALGFGGANREVSERNEQGQDIGTGQRLAYAGTEGVIQGLVAHYLGKLGAGGFTQEGVGELTQTVPLQNLIRRLSPELLETIQGTDGSVLVPTISRVLLNAGVGAGQNEVAMIASEIAKSAEGITGSQDKDLLSRVLEGTPGALVSGAAQAVPFALHGELTGPGEMSRGPVEEVPQENVVKQGTAGGTQRVTRFAPEDLSFLDKPVSPTGEIPATETPAAEKTNLPSTANLAAQEEDANQRQQDLAAGRQLPLPERLSANKDFTDLTAKMQEQAKESLPELPRGNGMLPENTDLRTGEPEHQLIDIARLHDPSVKSAEMPDHLSDDVANFEQARGVSVIPIEADKVSGFQHPATPDAVLFNVNDPARSFRELITHEWAHTFMDQNPDAAQQVLRTVSQSRRNELLSEYTKDLTAQMGPEAAKQYMAKNGDQELFATIMGKAAGEQDGVWNKVLQRDPGVWGKIKDVGSTILNSFTQEGRTLNRVRSLLGQTMGVPLSAQAEGGGRLAPRSYLDVGHKWRGDDTEKLWWKDEEGHHETDAGNSHDPRSTHIGMGVDDSGQLRGRIDNKKKEVSVAGGSEGPIGDRQRLAAAKDMQSRYPDHQVYISESGKGMTLLEDALTNGRFMLTKLGNIAHSDEDVKDYKDQLNANSPADAIHFETTREDKFKRAVFDSQAPLIGMIRTAYSRVGDISKLSPEAFVRRVAGFSERRYQQMKSGLRSLGGEEVIDQKTGRNLNTDFLIEPIGKIAKITGEKTDLAAAHAISANVAESTLERYQNRVKGGMTEEEAGKQPLSGIGQFRNKGEAPGHADVAEAKEFLAKAQAEPQWDHVQEFNRRLRLWGNEHIKMAVESGILSADSAKAMADSNQFYSNMQRVMEDNRLLGSGDFNGTYKRFSGSNRMIDNPLANVLQSTEQIAHKAEENFTKQSVVNLVKPFNDMIQPADKAGKDTIQVMENGQPQLYHVDPDVAQAVNGWGTSVPTPLWGALSIPGKIKLWGTLLRPMFQWNHFRKQSQNRLVLGESGGMKGFANFFSGFDTETKQLLDTLGGTMAHGRDMGTSTRDFYNMISKKLTALSGDGNTLLSLPKKAWEGYRSISEWADAFNRVVEFKSAVENAKKRGMDDLSAQTYGAWKARDLMDFSVAGSAVKAINRIAYQPFMNAEIQGLRKMYDLFRTDPVKASTRMAIFGLLPSMIPYFWAKSQGKDAEKAYQDTPLAQRIMFNQFQVGNYRVMTPKGQVQAMASALWEAFLDKHNGNVGTWFKAMADSGLIPRQLAGQGLEIGGMPTGMREAMENYSWFYDRHIIPPDQEGLAVDLRHTDGASSLAKMMAQVGKKAGWEVDPRMIDHSLASDFGTVGIDAQTASNLGTKGKPLANTSLLSYADTRLPPGYSSVGIQDAMTAAKKYNDTTNPLYKTMQDALSKSYQATTVEDRNDLVKQARDAADQVNKFYEEHGQQILDAKEALQKFTAVEQEAQAAKQAGQQLKWGAQNPDKVALLREGSRIKALEAYITERRTAMANPKVSDSTKQAIDNDLPRLYGLLSSTINGIAK